MKLTMINYIIAIAIVIIVMLIGLTSSKLLKKPRPNPTSCILNNTSIITSENTINAPKNNRIDQEYILANLKRPLKSCTVKG